MTTETELGLMQLQAKGFWELPPALGQQGTLRRSTALMILPRAITETWPPEC